MTNIKPLSLAHADVGRQKASQAIRPNSHDQARLRHSANRGRPFPRPPASRGLQSTCTARTARCWAEKPTAPLFPGPQRSGPRGVNEASCSSSPLPVVSGREDGRLLWPLLFPDLRALGLERRKEKYLETPCGRPGAWASLVALLALERASSRSLAHKRRRYPGSDSVVSPHPRERSQVATYAR